MDLSNNTERPFPLGTEYKKYRNLIKECFMPDSGNHSRVLGANYTDFGIMCPKTFDGLSCWDPTPAGAMAFQNCPDFVIGFDSRRLSYKSCTENGTWATHPQGDTPWSNYTTCVNIEDLNFRSLVSNIYVTGYAISIITLLLSLSIFFYFRSLHCTRIKIHIHLFISFVINNILWIIWYRRVVEIVHVVQNNLVWCQMLHIVIHYFMVASYIWMFCEGLHLHLSLVIVFIRDDLALFWFKTIGWGLSLVIVVIYASVRYTTPGATERCWMDYSEIFWIISAPVLTSLVASTVFLINVIRVLLTNVRPTCNRSTTIAAKKATRATLILIPLFGLHYIMMPLRPASGTIGEKIYDVISAIVTSLQGCSLAILFCFTNHEVLMAIRNRYKRYRRGNEIIALTGVTVGDSLANTRENIL
ncbi:calcitonin gene-related peptide type 1 receptor [Manduca sexta]|nr:calcitonin gene-related peptide type 1 receptor [Manduca sexta]